MTASEVYKTYKNMMISTAVDKLQIVSMLYEGALGFAIKAKEFMERQRIKEKAENIDKLTAVLSVLRESLDESSDAETVDFLRGLYDYILSEIFASNAHNDPGRMDKVIKYLTEMSRIWNTEVMKKH